MRNKYLSLKKVFFNLSDSLILLKIITLNGNVINHWVFFKIFQCLFKWLFLKNTQFSICEISFKKPLMLLLKKWELFFTIEFSKIAGEPNLNKTRQANTYLKDCAWFGVVSCVLMALICFCLFVYTRLLLRLPMPSPSPTFRLCALVKQRGFPSCLTLGFSHCFLSVIRSCKNRPLSDSKWFTA